MVSHVGISFDVLVLGLTSRLSFYVLANKSIDDPAYDKVIIRTSQTLYQAVSELTESKYFASKYQSRSTPFTMFCLLSLGH